MELELNFKMKSLKDLNYKCTKTYSNSFLSKQVIAIKDIIRPPLKENFNDVYIVYELMDTDLHQIIQSNQTLTDDHCRVWPRFLIFSLSLQKLLRSKVPD